MFKKKPKRKRRYGSEYSESEESEIEGENLSKYMLKNRKNVEIF